MKKIISFLLLLLGLSFTFSNVNAQIIRFPDDYSYYTFSLNNVYYSNSKNSNITTDLMNGKPSEYYSVFEFGRKHFSIEIYSKQSRHSLEVLVPIFGDKFFQKKDTPGTNAELYEFQNTDRSYTISFSKSAQYPDDWIEVIISLIISDKTISVGKSNLKPKLIGNGKFIYNTKSHKYRLMN